MPHLKHDTTYNALHRELTSPLVNIADGHRPAQVMLMLDHEYDDTNNVIIHKVPQTKGDWTHIEDLDSFFTRVYRYYVRGGFYSMLISDIFYLIQFIFIVWFSTFLVHCVNYPRLFRTDPKANRSEKLSLNDVIYPSAVCVDHITLTWWSLIILCILIWFIRFIKSVYYLYYAYDTKLFYNNALKIQESDLVWVNWLTIQEKVKEAQQEQHMCVHKQDINELDIYHRILRFDNYMVAMLNKNLLPLQIHIPFISDIHYLSSGLKWNLEFLLFYSPWSPWENCWQLRECYKDNSKRLLLATQLRKQVLVLAFVNLILAPLIQAWQILYFFFNYVEIIKRSPASLRLRTWSLYAQVTLRHYNELDHELNARLRSANKPAIKYLASFRSPIITAVAKGVVFLSGSILGVLVLLSVYDEDVLTVENLLSIITILGCIVAAARGLINEQEHESVCPGLATSEHLLGQILGHAHYLPNDWIGRAHTEEVAKHFQNLFQYQAVYIIFELLSPVLSPLMLLSLSYRALDIVDFYRNFTVSVLGIGDVCSFAQLDIRKHGHTDRNRQEKQKNNLEINKFKNNQREDDKSELSLVAFSCRHPAWEPTEPAQRKFLRSLRRSIHTVVKPQDHINETVRDLQMHQSFTSNTIQPAFFSNYEQKYLFRLPNMDDTTDEEDDKGVDSSLEQPMHSQLVTLRNSTARDRKLKNRKGYFNKYDNSHVLCGSNSE